MLEHYLCVNSCDVRFYVMCHVEFSMLKDKCKASKIKRKSTMEAEKPQILESRRETNVEVNF